MNAPTTRPDAALIDTDDIGYNTTDNPSFSQLIDKRLSRRSLLRGGAASAGVAMLGSLSLAACGGSDDNDSDPTPEPTPTPEPGGLKLSFDPVAHSLADAVMVPAGYTASVLLRLGDPITTDVPGYKNDGTDDPSTYDRRAGDHHDGMSWFGIDSSGKWTPTSANRGLLVQNHESLTPEFLHPNGRTMEDNKRMNPGEVLREFYLHGVSIVETVKGADGKWGVKLDSKFNRRVHTLTPMELAGPVRGTDYVVTKHDPNGVKVRGTVNNCANGTTPWGTYLACEENWRGYFWRLADEDNAKRSEKEITAFNRDGVNTSLRDPFYGFWATTQGATSEEEQDSFDRWNAHVRGASAAEDYRNGPNTYGWVVEIDPFDPNSTPKKRTALGRFAHEGAALGPVVPGKPLVWYQGDDARNDYFYKYVSNKNWDPADANGGMAAGDKYLDDGKLYVARFNDDGSGEWLELSIGKNGITADNEKYAFADQADVLIHARLAADAAGATKMDRPEWASINPKTGDVYLTLTNNNKSNRGFDKTDAANPRYYNDAGNPNGHIVRLTDGGAPDATRFEWDVYLFGAPHDAGADVNISGLSPENDFSSPDGLWFSEVNPGLAWIQTDDGAYTKVTNCMMLAAIPGQVGDGERITITNQDKDGNERQQATIVGAKPGEKGTQLSRFLVGPKGCEITGIAESGDGRAIFVNIQHPGENTKLADLGDPSKFESHWPDGGNARPRSATIVITRDDGGVIAV